MVGALRFLGLGTCLAMAMLGCTGSSRPPPVRGPDTGTTPDATAGSAAAVSGVTASAENIVNVYNWSDFIDPSVIPAFEREYGIKVNYDVFDSNEELETKLLVGQSNYDVVVPAGASWSAASRPGSTRSSTRRSCRISRTSTQGRCVI